MSKDDDRFQKMIQDLNDAATVDQRDSDKDWEIGVVIDPSLTPGSFWRDKQQVKDIKIALTLAEDLIKYNQAPADTIWLACLNGLATKLGSQVVLISELLKLEYHEQVVTWYLSAKFSTQEVVKWLEEAGLTDNEIVYALIMANPWKNNDYESLTDAELFGVILASGWEPPRQMAAMIANDVITSRNISDLVKYMGSEWIVEMIGRSGCFSVKCLKALQNIYGVEVDGTRKKIRQWSLTKIWQCWDKVGIANHNKIDLLLKVVDVNQLIEFLRSLPQLGDQEIVAGLLLLGMPLSRLAIAYAPKSSLNASSDTRLLHAKFTEVLLGMGKSDQEIVELLNEAEFTLQMIATGLANAGWEAERVITAMIAGGCDVGRIAIMVNNGAEASINDGTGFWVPAVALKWKKALWYLTEAAMQERIFGQTGTSRTN